MKSQKTAGEKQKVVLSKMQAWYVESIFLRGRLVSAARQNSRRLTSPPSPNLYRSFRPTYCRPQNFYPPSPLMADRRPSPSADGGSRAKRIKTGPSDMDPKSNPYLAHHYEDDANGHGNGYGADDTPLAKFKRHQTTAAQAARAEDGPNNPFTGQPLSQKYFNILKARRDLPVHAQR
jgi:hypothetical protein